MHSRAERRGGQIALLPIVFAFLPQHQSGRHQGALAFYRQQTNQEYFIGNKLIKNSCTAEKIPLLTHLAVEAGGLIIYETNQSMQINQQILVAHLLNGINPVLD